jgi:hypothetical protein
MDIPLLRDVVIIFAISITVIFLFSVIRVPTSMPDRGIFLYFVRIGG